MFLLQTDPLVGFDVPAIHLTNISEVLQRASDMNNEEFQRDGDRFPLTRQSLIEAVGSLGAEERIRHQG